MNHDIAIKVDNLTKIYHLYDKPQDRLKEALHPFKKSYHHDFYAMKDVSFEIKRGETVGILGRNGAGKSTLLKMITGVLTPTSGSIEIHGKIASLLELGAGFNPEMTGIENIYLNGTLMGFTKEEMDKKVDAIIDFADIGEFINQPAKMYSSGMYARLAFAVAINVEPEILIIDEALSVGDAAFSVKSLRAIKKFTEKGISVLFVSHDITSVRSLCDRAIWIENGTTQDIGDVEDISNKYIQSLHISTEADKQTKSNEEKDKYLSIPDKGQTILNTEKNKIWGNNKIEIVSFNLLNHKSGVIKTGENVNILLNVKANEDIIDATIGFGISFRNKNGLDIFVPTSIENNIWLNDIKHDEVYQFTMEFKNILIQGEYIMTLQIENREHGVADYFQFVENAMTINVISEKYYFGLAYTDAKCSMIKVSND